MTQKLILSIVLQDIIRNREGMPAAGYWMYFYDKRSPTTLRNAYYKNQEGTAVPAPNPLQLDENGALPHKLYYFVDVDDPGDRYTVELKCRYGNSVAPELVFNDLPYFQEQQADGSEVTILSDNLFIDGQFNIGLQIDDRGQGDGYVAHEFSHVPIAGLSWQFIRNYADSVQVQDRTDVDRIFIKEITESERIREGNPRFYLNIICEKPGKTPALQKILAFRSSNVLWGTAARAWIKFYAWKSGDEFTVNLVAVRDFGSKSSAAPQSMPIDQFLIDSDTPQVYYTSLSLLDFTVPADVGDDQSLTLRFSLPHNREFNFKATNFYCAEASAVPDVDKFKYPVQNSDLAKSNLLFSSFKESKYSIDNSYSELVFAIDGLKFVDNIGEIIRYPKRARVNEEDINLLKCDGRALDSRGISPLGIEYKRLYDKLDHAPVAFDMLQTKDVPNWFNAISSTYIKNFALNHNVKVRFDGDGVVNSKPEGDDIGHLWLETTFHANKDIDYNFQYVTGADVTTCCHAFDITADYLDASETRMTSSGISDVSFADSDLDFPGYFKVTNKLNRFRLVPTGSIPYKRGIDKITEQTKAHYSVKEGFFYLTVNLDYQEPQYPSGLSGFFTPVNLNNRTYDIGFPLIIPQVSATFLQENSTTYKVSQNYFLFSPWYVNSMSSVSGTYVFSSSSDAYATRLLSSLSKTTFLPIKTWNDHVIYKQSATEERTPGKPNVLFANKNSVITYAMQHKALFTQRCLYVIKFKEVKAGDFIGLKTYNNTGSSFDTVIWWSVDGEGDMPSDITSKEFREIKATKSTTTEELADMIASDINNKGTTMFNIPSITDDKYDYYVRY